MIFKPNNYIIVKSRGAHYKFFESHRKDVLVKLDYPGKYPNNILYARIYLKACLDLADHVPKQLNQEA